jgi:predicted NAD/FAD-binding protein
MLNAQLSWVLSASRTAVEGTPAASILGYARGLTLSLKTCLVGSRNFVSRITPSIGALERALAFGCDIRLGRAVVVEGDRCIDGVAYDAVIVATPPGCTRAVLPAMEDLAVFDQFATETRSLIIHRDASLMPSNRGDWRSLNVTCASDRDAASLTVWLNAFYPELKFDGDIFETWAPRTPPSHVIREVALPRVVQTVDQHKLHARIAALQGRNGIYFAGAHVVPGMGLLEQACAAGDAAADGVVRSLRAGGFEC